jgi:sugar phosphate permease
MISETKTENASQRPTNILLKYQIGMFCLCYFAWVTVHIQREFWAMSKKNIKVQHPELTKTFFGAIDTSLFFTYALAQFFTGAIGDMYPQRLVLSISFTIQAVLFFFVGVGGSYEIFHLWWFGSLFALIGLI